MDSPVFTDLAATLRVVLMVGACSIGQVACEGGGRADDSAASAATLSAGSLTEVSGGTGASGASGPATSGSTGDTGGSGTGAPTSGAPGDCLLTIDPPKATILIDNGVHMPVQLQALCDGLPVTPLWIADPSFVASIDDAGLVTAGGSYGGKLPVKAQYAGNEASAEVDVFLKVDLVPPEITDLDRRPCSRTRTTTPCSRRGCSRRS